MKTFSVPCLLAVVVFASVATASSVSDDVSPKYSSIVDNVVSQLLDDMRKALTNLTVPDFNETVTGPGFNLRVAGKNNVVKNAEKFVKKHLSSSLVPLTIKNLTLTWDNVSFATEYDMNGTVDLEVLQNVTEVYGKGKGSLTLEKVFFTVGVRMALQGGGVRVLPKGLFNFDVFLGKATVVLESLLGSPEVGQAVGTFLGNALPDFVNVVKKPLFDAFHDDIVKFLNSMLSGKEEELLRLSEIAGQL